ncbi:MAG: hypothetical protein ACLUHE_01980 [Christensenellales bacterium]
MHSKSWKKPTETMNATPSLTHSSLVDAQTGEIIGQSNATDRSMFPAIFVGRREPINDR